MVSPLQTEKLVTHFLHIKQISRYPKCQGIGPHGDR